MTDDATRHLGPLSIIGQNSSRSSASSGPDEYAESVGGACQKFAGSAAGWGQESTSHQICRSLRGYGAMTTGPQGAAGITAPAAACRVLFDRGGSGGRLPPR